MKMARVHVHVSGRVQGVCFRMETKQAALERNLTGWVRNLPDGRVEALFEGPEHSTTSMVKWCAHGPMHAVVEDISIVPEPYSGQFDGFDIRY